MDKLWLPIKVLAVKKTDEATYLKIKTDPHLDVTRYRSENGVTAELRFDDGRRISADQRKKLYATFRDISDHTGELPEWTKEYFKFMFCAETGQEYFSLSDCDMTTAMLLINYVIEWVIQEGIPLTQLAIERVDDIGRFIYYCLKYKKCCICGLPYPKSPHHIDAIGMGNDRRKVDDSKHLKLPLCASHHAEIHTIGDDEFCNKYKVFGILFTE